jgi:hypothetical protein
LVEEKLFSHLLRIVVLLTNGDLEAVECQDQDVFLLARIRNAGICGTFEDCAGAAAFIAKLHAQQKNIPGWNSMEIEL